VRVFLIAQVFFVTNYNISAVGLFLLVEVIAIFVFYTISSCICKKVRAIWMTRIATVLACGFLVLTIVWSQGLENYYMLFGAMWGAVLGLYWGAQNFLITKVFGKERIMSYFSMAFILIAIVGIVFPFTFGLAIEWGSWMITSGFVLAVGVIQLVFSFIIKTGEAEQGQIRMRAYFHALREKNHLKPAVILFISGFFAGFPFILIALVTVVVVMAYGSNIGLGALGSIFGAVGIVALLAYRFSPSRIKISLFSVAGILPLLVSVPLFFYVGPWSVIVFNLATVAQRIVAVEENSTRINATRYWGGEEFIIESHLFYEFAFMVGRVIACLLLLAVGWFGSTQILLATAIALVMLTLAVHAAILLWWRRKYAN